MTLQQHNMDKSNVEVSSDSGSDDLIDGSWSLNKRKKIALKTEVECSSIAPKKLIFQSKKFEELRAKSSEIRIGSAMRRQKTEIRRSRKIVKKALKDPWIKSLVDSEIIDKDASKNDKEEWTAIKPYLSINKHLAGPIAHRDCGPKTELESMIEDCIKEGDFEKAELLSDKLANREFAVKIAHAFAAKKCQEQMEKQKAEEKKKQMKKIRWTFDAKERWQMKGNM